MREQKCKLVSSLRGSMPAGTKLIRRFIKQARGENNTYRADLQIIRAKVELFVQYSGRQRFPRLANVYNLNRFIVPAIGWYGRYER